MTIGGITLDPIAAATTPIATPSIRLHATSNPLPIEESDGLVVFCQEYPTTSANVAIAMMFTCVAAGE